MNSLVTLNIKTKNKNILLNNIYKLNINIIELKIIKYNLIELTIDENDLDKIDKLKLLNDIYIKDYKGRKNIINKIKFYYIFFIFIIIGIIVLILLSNIIFNIEVISDNKNTKDLVYSILENEGIKVYSFKKSSTKIKDITNKIINNNKEIEWLSITTKGNSYIVNVIRRNTKQSVNNKECSNIVSKYKGTIKKIHVYNGEKLLEVGDYVNYNDIIVSGNITYNDEVKKSTYSSASVYAEVWKKVTATYDMYSYSINKKYMGTKLVFNFINNNYSNEHLFIIKNNIIPIYIGIDKIYKLNNDFGMYSESEYVNNAIYLTYEYMNKNLEKDEYIISNKLLKYKINSNKIYIEVFYKLYLNIGIEEEC